MKNMKLFQRLSERMSDKISSKIFSKHSSLVFSLNYCSYFISLKSISTHSMSSGNWSKISSLEFRVLSVLKISDVSFYRAICYYFNSSSFLFGSLNLKISKSPDLILLCLFLFKPEDCWKLEISCYSALGDLLNFDLFYGVTFSLVINIF